MKSRLVLLVAAAAMSGCLSTGCAFIRPTTQFAVNPITRTFSFTDTKDNDITLKGAGYSTETGFKIDELVISNKSSPVIEANVAQMMAFVEQQRAANEGITAALAGISQIVANLSEIVSGLVPGTPTVRPSVPAQ